MERATVAHRPPRTASVKEHGLNDARDYAKANDGGNYAPEPFRNAGVSVAGVGVETSAPSFAFHALRLWPKN